MILTTNNTNGIGRISFKAAFEANRCRRRRRRTSIKPSSIRAWTERNAPANITSIEIDTRGARLLLPWGSTEGDTINLAVANDMGEYHITAARVVWTRRLENSTRVIAGVCFEEEVQLQECRLAA